MYSNVLVPVDITYKTDYWLQAPLETAAGLAKATAKSTIHVLSVIPRNLREGFYADLYSEDVACEAKRKLDDVVKTYLDPQIDITTRVKESGVCHEILSVAHELSADVIVMASHGPLIRDYLLGSNAGHIALHAPCPVFVVRAPDQDVAA